jgi:hypothetical protein
MQEQTMRTRMWATLVLAVAALGQLVATRTADAQQYVQNFPYYTGYQLNRNYYFPYYYFPHNYWPVMTPRYPEPPGAPYMRPPSYMAYPAFRQPSWTYDLWQPMRYYRGSHFWLDQF